MVTPSMPAIISLYTQRCPTPITDRRVQALHLGDAERRRYFAETIIVAVLDKDEPNLGRRAAMIAQQVDPPGQGCRSRS